MERLFCFMCHLETRLNGRGGFCHLTTARGGVSSPTATLAWWFGWLGKEVNQVEIFRF